MTTSGNAATDAARSAARGRPADLIAVPVSGLSAAQVAEAATTLRAVGTGQVMLSVLLTAAVVDQVSGGDTSGLTALADALPQGSSSATPIVRVQLPAQADSARGSTAARAISQTLKAARPGAVVAWTAPRGVPAGEAGVPEGVDLIALDVPSGVAWSDLLAGEAGMTAWSDHAARAGKRLLITWSIDRASRPEVVESMRRWLEVSAQADRLSAETVSIAPDANPAALAAYNRLWR